MGATCTTRRDISNIYCPLSAFVLGVHQKKQLLFTLTDGQRERKRERGDEM